MGFFAPTNFLSAMLFAALGVLIVFLSRSVRAGNVKILAGYDAATVKDKAGLAAWAGNNLLLMGYLQIAAGLLMMGNVHVGGLAFFLATLWLTGRIVWGSFRFYR